MDDALIPALFVTANVGSIFEDPQNLLKIWIKEFLMNIQKLHPKFLALHCQEVGGKNYEESMRHVEDFVRMLMASEELREYGQVRVYLDEDFTCTERFTALGNLYFIHNSLKNIQIWDYKAHKFLNLEGKEVHSGNIERVTTKEKSKFPQDLFPECKWSRKGFMRTRWNVSGTVFDLINIHLFHDASNFIAMESFPSVYSKNRQNALTYALQRFSTDEFETVPFFIFGDFNFRLNMKDIIQKITNSTIPVHIKSAKNGEIEKVMYKDKANENKIILTVEKKVFDLNDHEEFFCSGGKWLQEFDQELEEFQDELFEFDKDFPPSYPFQEEVESGTFYMRTRCPAWCDRILLSKSAKSLIDMSSIDSNLPILYELVGADVAMGDHKPVMLLFRLQPEKGRLPPFVDMCVFQSHLLSRRTLSHSPLLLSSDHSFVANGTVSTASYLFDDCGSCCNGAIGSKNSEYPSVLWSFNHISAFHSLPSEEKRFESFSDICTSAADNCHIIRPQSPFENFDVIGDCRTIYPENMKCSSERHALLHAYPSSRSTFKHLPQFGVERMSYKCCPCVLL